MDHAPEIAALAIAAVAVITVVRIIASTVLRLQAAKQAPVALGHDDLLEARLARIESAVDAIAIEVERAGELQRFMSQLNAPQLNARAGESAAVQTPAPVLPRVGESSRPITPH